MASQFKEDKIIQKLKRCIFEGLKDEEVKIVLFGSRVRGKVYSDIDIGLIPKKEMDRKKITLLRETIEELNIPYKVDIVEFSLASPEFKKEALKEVVVWKD
ncbi:MAG: nucleotidyltransferase domain-containing protein [bacterium]